MEESEITPIRRPQPKVCRGAVLTVLQLEIYITYIIFICQAMTARDRQVQASHLISVLQTLNSKDGTGLRNKSQLMLEWA